jgi:methylase of polypeptide subunit release factors
LKTDLPACGHADSAWVTWTEDGEQHRARWRSERGAPAPARVMLVDDTLTADAAFRLAHAGTALLWRGDFHNARQLLQAMARRIDRPAQSPRGEKRRRDAPSPETSAGDPAAFHRHRQLQAQRARVLSSVLIGLAPDFSIPLRRAPDWREACAAAWGAPAAGTDFFVVSLRELQGIASAHAWKSKGVFVPALNERIQPHYGVYSPLRGEYVQLVEQAPLPEACRSADGVAFDIGTGSGVLAALLARRGVTRMVATDIEPRALACAAENLQRLGLAGRVSLQAADLFPDGRAALIVCNPPWIPARAGAPIERAVYDEGGRMLAGFVTGLAQHLLPGGEGWLVLSDLAEHLGLRTRAALLAMFEEAGLQVVGRLDTRPHHAKVGDTEDALHAARAAEVTSLWRLVVASSATAGPHDGG